MTRQNVKFAIVLVVLFSILIAAEWKNFEAWGILIFPAASAIAVVVGILLSKWVEK